MLSKSVGVRSHVLLRTATSLSSSATIAAESGAGQLPGAPRSCSRHAWTSLSFPFTKAPPAFAIAKKHFISSDDGGPMAHVQSAAQPAAQLPLSLPSHSSPEVAMPLPQAVGVQLESQPSPSIRLPSS